MVKRKIWAVAFTLAVIAFTLFIFSNSAKVAEESAKQSGSIVAIIKDFIHRLGGDTAEEAISFLVRKAGHLTEYFILSAFTSAAIYLWSEKRSLIYASPIYCFIVAVIDEFAIQGNTAGRSAEWRDCFIDLFGAIFALIFILYIIYLKNKKAALVSKN